MHRPPRPALKSSQMISLHPLRRIMTPEGFYRDQDAQFQEAILKSMRDNALPGQLHQSTHQSNNAENSETSLKQDPVIIKAPTMSQPKSFKIRNHAMNHRVKENSIPIKSARKPITRNSNMNAKHKTIEIERLEP